MMVRQYHRVKSSLIDLSVQGQIQAVHRRRERVHKDHKGQMEVHEAH